MCAVLHAVSHVQHFFCSKKLCSCDCYYECLVCCIGYCLRYVPVRGVARNSFRVGIIFLLHDTTVLYTSSLTTSAAISAQNNFQGLILGGYIYRYTSPPVATPLVPVSLIFLCHTEVAWSGVGQLIFAVATLLIVLNEALSRGLIGI